MNLTSIKTIVGGVTGTWWFYPALIAVLLVSFFWWLRVHDNGIREAQKPETRKDTLQEVTEQNEKNWAPILEQIKEGQMEATRALSEQILMSQQVTAARNADRTALVQTIGTLSGTIAKLPSQVAVVPAGKLPDEIRKVLVELRQ